MENCNRQDPPVAAAEKEMLEAFLDYHRATLLCKTDGVSDETLRLPGTPSGVTLLGMVKHLAYTERWWFRQVFAGEDLPGIRTTIDWDATWRIESDETPEQIFGFYRDETEHCRRAIRGVALDDVARRQDFQSQGFTLRWIILHMLEETARHNGHADILRENIDGQTGE